MFEQIFNCLFDLCHCLRCTECHSTLLPGSYKLESNSGVLVCTHHATKHTSANQNGRPDLTKADQSARIGRSTVPRASLPSQEAETLPSDSQPIKPGNDGDVAVPAVSPNEADSAQKDAEGDGEKREAPRPSTPPNPFDESDEGEKEEDDSKPTANCVGPSTPVDQGVARPVPAPRRVSEPTPPPRPAPRIRLLRPADGQWLFRRNLLMKHR